MTNLYLRVLKQIHFPHYIFVFMMLTYNCPFQTQMINQWTIPHELGRKKSSSQYRQHIALGHL